MSAMFAIPDDEDLLWNDDFPLEDLGNDVEVIAASNNKSLKFESHSKLVVQDEHVQELPKHKSINIASEAAHLHTFGVDRKNPKKDKHNGSFVACAEELANSCKRKFPGPAGVLPPSPLTELNAKPHNIPDVTLQPKIPAALDLKNEPHILSWSQASTDDIFTSAQWNALVSDLGKDAQQVLSKFSIRSALLKARRKLLNKGKLPLVIGVMENFEMQGSDASFVLRDPSGKMNGALHRDLFKDTSTALQAGSVLVLRQVSVISPSSRTHYLNITPGNVALIYTANREAMVSKRSWQVSQSLTNDTKLRTKGSETRLLNQIIEDSEKEMIESLRISHHELENCKSTSLSPGSSEFLLSNANSVHMSPFTPRGALAPQRPRSNFTSFGASGGRNTSSTSSLFTSTPTLPLSAQRRNVNYNVVSGNTSGDMRQSPSGRNMSSAFPVSGYNYSLNESKVVCNVSARADRTLSTDFQNNCSELLQPARTKVMKINTSLDQIKTNDNTVSNIDSFNDDFSDSDDQMMLQICDEVLSQPQAEHYQQAYTRTVDHQGELDWRNECRKYNSVPPSIINKAFDDCRKENQRIVCNSESEQVYNTNCKFSDTRNKLKSAGNNSVDLKISSDNTSIIDISPNHSVSPQTSNIVKRFSFKRSSTPSHSPMTSSIAKRPMYNVADENTVSLVKSLFNYQQNLPKVNSYQIPGMDIDLPTDHSTSISAVHLNLLSSRSPVQHTESSSTPVPYVTPSISSVHPSLLSSKTAAVHDTETLSDNTMYSKTMMKSDKDSNTDSCNIQAAKRGSDSTNSHQITSMFSQWDDDLNDDLLLSQLSDEF